MPLLNRFLNTIAIIPLVLLVLLVNASVFGRYGLGWPIRWAEEVSGILMIWLVMLGAIIAERDQAHLRIPILLDAMSPRAAGWLDAVMTLLSITTLGIFSWLSYKLAASVTYKVTDLLRISYWWLDIALSIGFTGAALVMAIRLRVLLHAQKIDERLQS